MSARPLFLLGFLGASPALATSYVIDGGYQTVCLDLATGLDLDVTSTAGAAPLTELPTNLLSRSGLRLEYSPGNTRHLEHLDGSGAHQTIQELPNYPSGLQVYKDLAIFTLGPEDGGRLYAWDLAKHGLAWELVASDRLPDLPSKIYSSVHLDGDAIYFQVDQRLLRLDAETGQVRWITALPRQVLGSFDSAWTHVGRFEADLLVATYHRLFRVQRDTGRLLWSFDVYPFGHPWPKIEGSRGCVERLKNAVPLFPESRPRPKARRVVEVDANPDGPALRLLEKESLKKGTPLYHGLRWAGAPPPLLRRVQLDLIRIGGDEDEVTTVELSNAVAGRQRAYVEVYPWTRVLVLRVDGREVSRLDGLRFRP